MIIVSWNLLDGGFDNGSAGRLARQLELLADLRPDVALVQEAKHWLWNGAGGLHLAERVLGMRAYLAHASRHGCHVAVLIRPHSDIEVIRERHEEHHPFWHAQARVVCHVAGLSDPLVFASTHFAPFNPALRVEEACASSDLAKGLAVLAGDFNDPGLGDPPADWGGLPCYKVVRHTRSDVPGWPQDDRAAHVLHEAGFVDVAAHLAQRGLPGVLGATAGFGMGSTPIRCDRIYVTGPLTDVIADYGTVASEDSDHHLLTARLAL